MTPRDFLAVAAEWAAGAREAEWRSAVSRAYYAAFHTARAWFDAHGFAAPRADAAHRYVWLRLANSGPPAVVAAGNRLNDLRGRRNRADYDLDRPLTRTTALDLVREAEDVIRVLESLAATPPVLRAAIDGIRAYERDVLRDVTWHG